MIYAILGPTGCGKTTLIEKIVEKYGYYPIYEEWMNNPYIKEAYKYSNHKFDNQQWFIRNDIERTIRAIDKSRINSVVIDKLFIQNYVYVEYDTFSIAEKKVLFALLDAELHLLNSIDTIISFKIPIEENSRRIRIRRRDFETSISNEWISKFNEGIDLILEHLSVKFPNIKIYKYNEHNEFIDENGDIVGENKIFNV